jgi:hypothetical protein
MWESLHLRKKAWFIFELRMTEMISTILDIQSKFRNREMKTIYSNNQSCNQTLAVNYKQEHVENLNPMGLEYILYQWFSNCVLPKHFLQSKIPVVSS